MDPKHGGWNSKFCISRHSRVLAEKSQPFISVIVPVFNNAGGIALLLGALESQSYDNLKYEVIIVDNGSQDGTYEVASLFADKSETTIKVVQELAVGAYAARNKGVSEASGEILAFTDSDCVPTPTWIERGAASLASSTADGAAGAVEFTFIGERANAYEFLDSANKLAQETYVTKLGFAATANFIVRKVAVEDLGGFDSNLRSGGDYELGQRLTASGRELIYVGDAVVQHPARSTFREIIQKNIRVAGGQYALRKQGKLKHGSFSWKNFFPPLTMPRDVRWDTELSFIDKLKVRGTLTVGRYVNLYVRLFGGSAR
jgi:glycosyltransferase involved in cell wall biosynthesis